MTAEETDRHFMDEAIKEAREAAAAGEVPVGAVIVRDGQIIARAGNRRERDKCATAHAETDAIREACRVLGGWRLPGCTLYVTLEPCPMCAGAIVNARIPRVVIGAKDPRAGALGSMINLNHYPLNHAPAVEFGVSGETCAEILRAFFRGRRG